MATGTGQVQVAAVASSNFKLALGAVVLLTLICLALWVILVFALSHPTSGQTALINTVSHVFAAGTGAIFGLLGGKFS